jgi:hypothetical protein
VHGERKMSSSGRRCSENNGEMKHTNMHVNTRHSGERHHNGVQPSGNRN